MVVSAAKDPRSLLDKMELGLWYIDNGHFHQDIPDEEKQLIANLLGNLLVYKLKDRMSAKAALDHEWFKFETY